MTPHRTPHRTPRVAVCWDVDGTLLLGGTIGTEVLGEAFMQVTGHPARFEAIRMGGHTDWLIGEALRDALDARDAAAIAARGDAFGHAMIAAVREGWRRRAGDLPAVAHTLPGVRQTVAALAVEPGVVQTLTTGNVRVGAHAKLTAVGLADGPIDIELGGYGEGPGARFRVVEQARAALAERFGAAPPLVVVGDTPRDVEAAHRAGAVAVGVATGRSSTDELRDAGAHHVFDDLADPGRLVAVVRSTGEDRHAAEAGR
jgi:phosphoglycolate phosphatase